MDTVDRIVEIISDKKISVRAFANSIGLKQQTLSNQLNRTRELSLSSVLAILTSFEDISAEWLMRGNGSMHTSNVVDVDGNAERLNRLIDTITTLQDVINSKDASIKALMEENRQLKAKMK